MGMNLSNITQMGNKTFIIQGYFQQFSGRAYEHLEHPDWF